MVHLLLLLLGTASAQTVPALKPDPATILAEMAPYRSQLRDTLRDGTWKTAPSETAPSDRIDSAFCLEQILFPTPGPPHSGTTLAVAEGIRLADYIVDHVPYKPRYIRTHYKEAGNTLAFWEGSERQYIQKTLGELWHDAIWAGRDTLLIRDDDGRVQTIYMEGTRDTDSCICEIPGRDNLCTGFSNLDTRHAAMADKPAFYTLVELVWEGEAVTGARISEVTDPNTGTLLYREDDPSRPSFAEIRTVSLSLVMPSPGTCSSPTDSELKLLALDWHAAEVAHR